MSYHFLQDCGNAVFFHVTARKVNVRIKV